jgi:anti-anti-sigma regulatory factor
MVVTTKRLDAEGKAAVVVAEGKLSGQGASDRLCRAMLAAIERYEAVVADLLAATDVDACAIGALAQAAATAGMAGKIFAVAAGGEVAGTIEGLGFAGALKLRESVEVEEL